MKKFLAVSLIPFALAACGQPADPDAPEPIRIGWIAPLSGDAAEYGTMDRLGTEIAVEKINAAGGIDGRPLEILYEDGKCAGKDAVTAYHWLVDIKHTKIIFGGLCSGETLAFAPLAKKQEILTFSAGSSAPKVSEAGEFIFRNAPSDSASGIETANYLWKNNFKKVAVVTENTEYGVGLREAFKTRWAELGGEITDDEMILPNPREVKAEMTKVRFSEPEAVVVFPQTGAIGGIFLKQAREVGMLDTPFFGNMVMNGDSFFTMAGKWAEGTVIWDALVDEARPEVAALLDEVRARSKGKKISGSLFATNAVDRANLVADALRSCGGTDADTECLRDFLSGVKDYRGLSGIYSFDENGDVEMEFTPLVAKDGKFVRLGGPEDVPAGSGSAAKK